MTEHIVKSYDDDLHGLKNEVMLMGRLVYTQWKTVHEAMEHFNRDAASAVIKQDNEVDRLEAVVDQHALQILALRQPVALDLRIVMAALKVAGSLERMGDYASNISRRILALSEPKVVHMDTPVLLLRMSNLVREMMEGVYNLYEKQDTTVLEQSWKGDVEVDGLYGALLRELLTHMMEDPRQIGACTHFLFIAKNIERVGDHLTNIAEVLHVMILGEPLAISRPHGTGVPIL